MQISAVWRLGWLTLVLPWLSMAQEQPERELFLQPVIGANVITLGWDRPSRPT